MLKQNMNLEEVFKEGIELYDSAGNVSIQTPRVLNLLRILPFEEIDRKKGFSFSGPTCFTCNGYYGAAYSDPTCDTCHSFLYPNAGPESQQTFALLQGTDDSDSGNDEPVEGQVSFKPPRYVWSIQPNVVSVKQHLKQIALVTFATVEEESGPPYESNTTIDELPPEVMMNVFEYLDELSLWSVGQVSERWRQIVTKLIRPDRWRGFIYARWPLLYVTYEDQNFYTMYTAMINSANCLKCIKQMIAQEEFDVEENSWRKHRLRTELRAMRLDPLEGIYAVPLDALCCHWQASIQGPVGSPYEGGLFFIYLQIPHTYPMCPPIVRFMTKILHPNISRHGDIGIDSIHHNWSLALTISKILISIQSLLTDPYCDPSLEMEEQVKRNEKIPFWLHHMKLVCMEPTVAALYMDNRPCFDQQARLWTWKYAMHGLRRH